MGFNKNSADISSMGFNQIATGISNINDAALARSSAKSVLMQSGANAKLMKNKAESTLDTALHLSHQIRRDGNREISSQRARVGAANVASSGSAMETELDMATRLEQSIKDNAHKAMEENRQLEYQANMEIWKGDVESKQLKRKARMGVVTGIANIASGVMPIIKKQGS